MLDEIIGIAHFLTDRAPRGVPKVLPRVRRENPWRRDGKPLVGKVRALASVKASLEQCIQLLGGLERLHLAGKTILVKPNFNSPDPFPASTELGFLRAALELLLDVGGKVVLGESSGGMWRPTRKTLAKAGMPELARSLGVEMVAFEDRPRDWVEVEIPGDYLRKVTVPRIAYEAEAMVYLPCMKVHRRARFSLSLKLGVGFIHPGERRALHVRNLEEKVAELNLIWQPDLVLMDGRKSFITRGPEAGQVVEPGVILASGDLVAIDLEALNVLRSYPAENRLNLPPLEYPQIAAALRHGLGGSEYLLVEPGAEMEKH